jgi:hypothetical protein
VNSASCGGWAAGDLVTYGQVQWGTTGTAAAALLSASYNSVYAATGGALEVGISGTGGLSIRFNSASAVQVYLPSSGVAGPLTGDVFNPATTASGILGGTITALALNVDFSAAGLLGGTVATDFGSLSICGAPGLPDMSVASFLSIAEATLGGANTGYSPAAIVALAQQINSAFLDGTPSPFAQDHLVNAASCGGGWTAGDVVTYGQVAWGADTANLATTAFTANFAGLYGAGLEVGIAGAGGNSIVFTSATRVNLFLPASGTSAALTNDLLNPTSTPSGDLGGETTALRLNVDLNDASLLGGTAGVRFGDLRICGITTVGQTGGNGLTVREFLSIANTALGGGSTNGFSYADLATLASSMNAAFSAGTLNTFADHLVNGNCT